MTSNVELPALDDPHRCFFCDSARLQPYCTGAFHKKKQDHGPFDLYTCRDCGSLVTSPPPSPASLEELYNSMAFGMSQYSRELLAENPEASWHKMCAKRLARLGRWNRDSEFSWIDVGAGGGELALRMAEMFPRSRGIAVDLHECPPALRRGPRNIEWRRLDLTQDDFAPALGLKADLVFATGVWEHVRRPDTFARNLVALLDRGGALYMTTPNNASIARRVMRTSWPYFLPGEHLCLPTPKGARLCLQACLAEIFGKGQNRDISVRPILVRYSVRFVFAKFNLPFLARLFPNRLCAFLPSGALEAVVRV